MTNETEPILQLQNIRKTFDSIVAVRDLSLTVPRGSIYGLIGPNGAGKTTTIRMLLNIIGPDNGTVTYGFQRQSDDPVDLIGYLPEERGLFKKMTLQDVLIFLAEIKSVPPAKSKPKIDEWLERVGLTEWKKRKVQELSKGMQQKVQFISTVLHEPELLVLDELFSGLDPVNSDVRSDRLRHELSFAEGSDLQAMLPEIIKIGRLDGLERVQPSLHQIFLTMVESGAPSQNQEGQPS
jgi:ABC-2 type transport system ATP-binding protein